jgi:hypothetical protein
MFAELHATVTIGAFTGVVTAKSEVLFGTSAPPGAFASSTESVHALNPSAVSPPIVGDPQLDTKL